MDLPGIELMQRLIVHVRRPGFRDVETIVDRFRCLAKMFLLVANKVLGACLDASTLNASDGVCEQFTSEIRIRTEALPITAALGRLSVQLLAARHILVFHGPTHSSDAACDRSE